VSQKLRSSLLRVLNISVYQAIPLSSKLVLCETNVHKPNIAFNPDAFAAG
jgi:hypothetical protein